MGVANTTLAALSVALPPGGRRGAFLLSVRLGYNGVDN